MKPTKQMLCGWIGIVIGLGTAATGFSQTYPQKSIRVLTTETGSGNDFLARLAGQAVGASMGQPIVVDNKPLVAAELVARATPDGYTLLVYGPPFWLAPYLREHVPYDPVKDFAPVVFLGESPNIVVVHPSVAANSISELIALAKAKPGQLNYGSGGAGAANHLAVELFNSMAGVKIVRVPYRGAAPALNSLIAGQLQIMFPVVTSGMPFVKSGQLRALAVTTAQPTTLAPNLPTVSAAGLPGYEASAAFGLFAPSKTDASIVNKLNSEFVKTLGSEGLRDKLSSAGIQTNLGPPQLLGRIVKDDMLKMGKVIKDAGIRSD
jgi:tripartite-type tricarboxylate transporter receptor subunit TctC